MITWGQRNTLEIIPLSNQGFIKLRDEVKIKNVGDKNVNILNTTTKETNNYKITSRIIRCF